MLKFKLFLLSACTFMCIPTLFAQETTLEQTRTEMNIVFRVGSSAIDATYMDNSATLERMVEWVNGVKADEMVDIVSVEFCGAASPEGSSAINRRLSRERLTALENYLRSKIDIPESKIVRNDQYIPWDNLHKMVSESDLADKAAVLAIIEKPGKTAANGLDSRINELKALNGGKTWNTLFNRYFAQMRNAYTVLVTCKSKKALEMEKPAPAPEPEPEPQPEPTPEPVVEQPKPVIVDYSPKKGDVTLAVTVGYEANTNVVAQPGNLDTYEVTPMTDLRFAFGIEGGWFVADRWKLSLAGTVSFFNNPGYSEVPGTVDGAGSIEDNLGEIPNYRAVADAQTFTYGAALGFDRYFDVKFVKNMLVYTGLRVGFAYGQNQMKYDEWTSMGKSIAETSSLRGAWTFGVDYFVAPKMFLGISVDPVSYTYNLTTYVPQEGLGNLSADSHKISAFARPTLRVGFKF